MKFYSEHKVSNISHCWAEWAKERGWKRDKVRRKSNKKNTHPSWKQWGNGVSCSPGLLLAVMEPPAQQSMCGSHSMEKPADLSGLCGNAPSIRTCQGNKIVGSHTLRKIQTWISAWLISVTVLDPTKILDLNFKGRFFSLQAGQPGWTMVHTCVCRHLHSSCAAFVFSPVPPLTKMASHLLSVVSYEF